LKSINIVIGSNNYNIYNKAFYGLKNHEKEFATPRELIEVNGIGPKIVDKLEKLYAADGRGNSQPVATAAAPKKPRGRPLKRSATDLDSMDPPPASKRLTVSAAVLPTQVPATQVPPPTLERPAMTPGPFQFWYISETLAIFPLLAPLICFPLQTNATNAFWIA
jgi:hypothetical protein